MNKVVIIFPCYNEEEILTKTKNEIIEYFSKLVSVIFPLLRTLKSRVFI